MIAETYLVSAIVSSYNAEAFIEGCLQDLLRQSLFHKGQLQIVIINSGSEQGEELIVKAYQKQYDHIIYLKTEREPLYAAWNRAIGFASGRYLTNANTDDRHRSDALEVMSALLNEHAEIDLVYGDCYVSIKPNESYDENVKGRRYRYPVFFAPDSLLHYQFGPQPMWRKSIHDKIGFFDSKLNAAGDYDFNIRFALAGLRALHVNEPLGLYLEHDNAISFRDDTMSRENEFISLHYKTPTNIDTLYRCEKYEWDTPKEHAHIFTDMGNRALRYYPAWESGKPVSDRGFAEKSFRQALCLDPHDQAAQHNLQFCTTVDLTDLSQILPSGLSIPTEHNLGLSPKILIACDFFWPSVGGVEIYVEDLGQQLIQAGYSVEIACHTNPQRTSNFYKGMRIHDFECNGGVHVGGIQGEGSAYVSLLVCGGFDAVIILSQPDNWVSYALMLLPEDHPRTIFLPSISADLITGWDQASITSGVIEVLRAADIRVAVTESGYDKQFMETAGLSTIFIPHATEQDASPTDFHEAHALSRELPLLVMVANFWPVKNHLRLIQTLQHQQGAWQLAIIGNPAPPHQEYYQEVLAQASKDHRVHIVGGLPRDQAASAIRDADILLVPSLGESAGPLVVLQAMSYGVPWLATPECNAVHNEAGGVIAPLADFPNVITMMIADSATRKKLGLLGAEHWRSCFSWSVTLPGFIDLIEGKALTLGFAMPQTLQKRNEQLVSSFFERRSSVKKPLISVIIPTYNRCEKLLHTLDSFNEQTLPADSFEVVVCNDGSTDATDKVVESFGAHYRLKYISQANSGAAAARNRAIKQASGHYILFLNDDMHPSPVLLEEHLKSHAAYNDAHSVVLGRVEYDGRHADLLVSRALQQYDLLFPQEFSQEGVPYDFDYFVTGNLSMSSHIFEKTENYFDETFPSCYCEDIELGYRLWEQGYKVYYNPRAIAYHDHVLTVEDDIRREQANTRNLIQLVEKHPELSQRYLGVEHLASLPVAMYELEANQMLQDREKLLFTLREHQNLIFTGIVDENLVSAYANGLKQMRAWVKRSILVELMKKYRFSDRTPKVSIIIPCYNYAHYLPEAFSSVMGQTFQDFEIIIVNDGSTDNTNEVVENLITLLPGHTVKLITTPNSGNPAFPRNIGVMESRGSYILFLDADDMLMPTFLEECVKILDGTAAISIAYTDQIYFDEKKNWTVFTYEYDFDNLLNANFMSYCSLFRRKVWDDVGGVPTDVGYEDWDFWIMGGLLGHYALRIPKPLFCYRQHETGRFKNDLILRDQFLKAQIILKHRDVYPPESVRLADKTISTARNSNHFRIIAIISAHNEGDVIYHVIGDLINQGVDVYLINHCSTDTTVSEASKWLGKGLLHIENFPEDAGYPVENASEYIWHHILIRKQQLASQLDADWFIHADADEFRESPWAGMTLADAIHHVDGLGYNAIDFELLNFRPINNDFLPGSDVRLAMLYFDGNENFNARQTKAWKNLHVPVDIVGAGGHDISFPDRQVFPVKFILRHYPVRSQEHGLRKVFEERKQRFNKEERAEQWHVQYDSVIDRNHNFIRGLSTLTMYDPLAVRERLFSGFPKFSGGGCRTILEGFVSIVILTFNQLWCTKECVESIREFTPEPHEIIFIDNGSSDGTLPWLKDLVQQDIGCRLIENNANLGFSKGCNQGIEAAKGEYVLLLNNDVVVTSEWLAGMIECIQREPDIGIVGPMTNNISGIQLVSNIGYDSVSGLYDYAISFREKNRYRRIESRRIVGFCMLFRKSLVDRIGLLDETFGSGNFEDDDYCLRAELAGYRNVIAGDVFIHHYGSQTFSGNRINYSDAIKRNKALYHDKWNYRKLDEATLRRLLPLEAVREARRLNMAGKIDAAVELLMQKGIRIAPDNPEPYCELAEILLTAGRYDEALQVIPEMPPATDSDLVCEIEAICHTELGNDDAAYRSATRAGGRPRALVVLGTLAARRGDLSGAEAFFRKALGTDPACGKAWLSLGMMHWGNGSRDDSWHALGRSVVVDPLNSAAVNIYKDMAARNSLQADALKVVSEAAQMYPDSLNLAKQRTELLAVCGKTAEALEASEIFLTKFGVDEDLVNRALQLRSQAGSYDRLAETDAQSISLCMIVKNEEKNLPACLASLKPVVDEIIIVDTGSTDRTVDMATIFGARVLSFSWNDNFSAARNFALTAARGSWILVMDADEVLSEQDHELLRQAVRESFGHKVCWNVLTRNYTRLHPQGWIANDGSYSSEERSEGWHPSRKVRLFPSDERIRFQGEVHEMVDAAAEQAGYRIKEAPFLVHHYGALEESSCGPTPKQLAYFELGLQKLADHPGDAAAIGELAVQAAEIGRCDAAVSLWDRFLALRPDAVIALFNKGFVLMSLHRYAEALIVSKRALELDPNHREAAFNYGTCELYVGDPERALVLVRPVADSNPDHPLLQALVAALFFACDMAHEGQGKVNMLKAREYAIDAYIRERISVLESLGKTVLADSIATKYYDVQSMS